MNFQYPTILIVVLLALPLILLLMVDGQRRLQKQLSNFISPRLLGALTQSFSRRLVWLRNIVILCTLVLLGIAAARPQWGIEEREIEGRGIDILFALDASNSMLAEDIVPNRIERTKLAIEDFIKTTVGDRFGIIAFAGNAFLQCPLTFDKNAFRLTLKTITPGIIPHRGTDIAAAIDEARSAFPKSDNAKILILMTDGEDLEESGIEAARDAAEDGLTIYTIGVGGSSGTRIPVVDRFNQRSFMLNDDGTPVITRLDEDTLKQIAQAAGGVYVPLGASGNGLERLYQERLATLPDQLREATVEQIPFERYAWFTVPALVLCTALFFIGNRRAGSARVAANIGVILFVLLSINPNQMYAVRPAYLGFKGLENEDWESAKEILSKIPEDSAETAYNSYNLAIARYQTRDFVGAVTAFETSLKTSNLELLADSFYNLGLTHMSLALGVDASSFNLLSINTALRESFEAAYEALTFGEQALLEIPLRKQAWTQAEGVLKTMRSIDEEMAETSQPARNRHSILLAAENAWINAQELEPEAEDISTNLEALQQHLEVSTDAWQELSQHEEMLPQIEDALEVMINELKRPTDAVIQAEELADELVADNDYLHAVELLEEIAKNDPTAEIYKQKQTRLREIVDILVPPIIEPSVPQPQITNP